MMITTATELSVDKEGAMQTANENVENAAVPFETLFKAFVAHDAALDTLCRRMECVRPGPDSDARIMLIEVAADRELDEIARIARYLCKRPATEVSHIKIKARVLWHLIKEEETESVADRLLHSLCNDLLDI